MNLINFIAEVVKEGLSVTLQYNKVTERIEGIIHIGSKCGTGTLYESGDNIVLETRYGQVNEVSSYYDIAEIAFNWYDDYKDREPFETPDASWVACFLEKGWIKAENKVVYKSVR